MQEAVLLDKAFIAHSAHHGIVRGKTVPLSAHEQASRELAEILYQELHHTAISDRTMHRV